MLICNGDLNIGLADIVLGLVAPGSLVIPVSLTLGIFFAEQNIMDLFTGHFLSQIVAKDIDLRSDFDGFALGGREIPLSLPGTVFDPELIHIFVELFFVDGKFETVGNDQAP